MENIVSVIIPTYNRANYITDALDSVKAQTYRPVEVVVVDDGSTDDTIAVVKKWIDEYSTSDLSAQLVEQANAGAPAARNHGIEVSRGKWVKFLDSDDILHPDCLSSQVVSLADLPKQSIVFGDDGYMDSGGRNKRPNKYSRPSAQETSFEYLLHHIVRTPTPLHRRKLLEDVGGFREDVRKGQEGDLHLRLALNGCTFVYEPGVVSYARVNTEGRHSVTRTYSVEKDPDAYVWIEDNKQALAKQYYGTRLPERIRKILAVNYWIAGRRIARSGHSQKAKYCFEEARTLCNERSVRVGSEAYKTVTSVLSPITVESATMKLKSLFN